MLRLRVIGQSRETRGSHDEATARIGQLDELRALAMAAVVLSHIAMAFGSRSRTAYWLNLPDLAVGVDLFFAISGFVVAVSLRQMVEAAEGNRVRRRRHSTRGVFFASPPPPGQRWLRSRSLRA
jgi:peptidoglycan/LPS O-acetylase OafA/YrhL